MSMKPLPKTLQKIVSERPDQFSEGWSEQDGFNERDPYNGWAHWMYLKRGWCNGDQGSHIIHEDSVKRCVEAVRAIKRCTCEDCVTGKFWTRDGN